MSVKLLLCVLDAEKKRLIETILLSTQNICLVENWRKKFQIRTLIWRPDKLRTHLVTY